MTAKPTWILIAVAALVASGCAAPPSSLEAEVASESPAPSTTGATTTTSTVPVDADTAETRTTVAYEGTITINGEVTIDAAVGSDASYRFTERRSGEIVGYDAASLTAWGSGVDKTWVRHGVPPGGPDTSQIPPTYDPHWGFLWETTLRELAATEAATAEWEYARRATDGSEGIQCTVRATIDRETSILLNGTESCTDGRDSTYQLSGLQTMVDLPPGTFVAPDIAGADDEGFAAVSIAEARDSSAIPVPLPDPPSGYALSSVSFANEPSLSLVTRSGMPSRDVTVVRYSSGFAEIIVTVRPHVPTREVGKGESAPVDWSDPWAASHLLRPPRATHAGAIDGAETTFEVDVLGGTATASTDSVVVTVEGPVPSHELFHFLASFDSARTP